MNTSTLTEQACQYILDQIRYGNLKDNERIDETKLIKELGASRTPVREALLQLSAEGVLVCQPRRGFFVRKLDEKVLAQASELIGLLDARVAEEALPFLTTVDFLEMEIGIQRMEFYIQGQQYEEYMDAQRAFHQQYRQRCENYPLVELLEHLFRKYVRDSFERDTLHLYETLKLTNEEHRRMLEAMRSKDAESLKQLIIKHWSNQGQEKKDILS